MDSGMYVPFGGTLTAQASGVVSPTPYWFSGYHGRQSKGFHASKQSVKVPRFSFGKV
jgi:hypothetical protein